VIVEPLFAGEPEVWAVLPEGNAKTTLLAGVALYYADYSPLPWIPIAASSRDQAEILAQQAYQMIRMSPGMQDRFKVYEGYRRIQPRRPGHPAPGSRGIRVYASDVHTGDGVIPYPLAVIDELHRHKDLRLYRLWKGKLVKRGAQLVGISTAGEPGEEFEETRQRIRRNARTTRRDHAYVRYEGSGLVMHEWAVQDPKKITDMRVVKEANPLSTITLEELTAQFESPTTDLGDWSRLKCNISARSASAAIAAPEWDDALVSEIPLGSHVDLGIDVAWKHDTFAIEPFWRDGATGVLGAPQVLVPPRDGSTLHPDEVKIALGELLDLFVVETAVIDLQRAEDVAAWLEDEHNVRVIAWPQGNAQAARDYEAFMEGLRSGTLKHTGDPILRQHVMNAQSRSLPGDKRRFDRPSSSRGKRKQDERVIDALTAGAMVNSYARSMGQMDVSVFRIEQM
jgi:phage terminase large subunit-like protein